MSHKIPLSRKGMFALVDERDAHFGRLYKWCVMGGPKRFYAARQYRDPSTPGRKVTVFLSQQIMRPGPDQSVRFVNGNTLDCRRTNLKLVPKRGAKPKPRPEVDPLDEEYQA